MTKKKKSLFREYAETIICAFVIAMVIRTFVVQAFKIPTGSMEPTLHGDPRYGDRIFVNKFIYRFKSPARGDIVVFKTKNIPGLDHRKDYIKRLIGLPGEMIEIKDNSVYINNKIANNSIIAQNMYLDSRGPILVPIEIPKKKLRVSEHFFLVWDHDKKDIYILSSIIYNLPLNTKPGDIFIFDPTHIVNIEQSTPFETEFLANENQLVEFREDGIYIDKVQVVDTNQTNHLYVIQGQYGMDDKEITIPEDAYYVLGDNSENSKDSRYWGVVPKENVKGKAMFIWWPPKRWGLVK